MIDHSITVPKFIDRELVCVDCNGIFDFQAGEAEFYWAKGLDEPKRCAECRRYRRLTLARSNALRAEGCGRW